MNRKGFALIITILMAVAGIMIIIGSIAYPAYQKAQNLKLASESAQTNTTPTSANPTTPSLKNTLKKIPSESVQTTPLLLHYYKTLNGTVGQPFSAQYNAEGGLPPYHFQLETGVGFPPHQVVLDTNGRLSGTPSVVGTSVFGVCVVDTAGQSVCGEGTITVVAGIPKGTVEIASHSCKIEKHVGGGGTPPYNVGYVVHAAGTATGDVGLTLNSSDNFGSAFITCDSWSTEPPTGDDFSNKCYRRPSDPPTTNWTLVGDRLDWPYEIKVVSDYRRTDLYGIYHNGYDISISNDCHYSDISCADDTDYITRVIGACDQTRP